MTTAPRGRADTCEEAHMNAKYFSGNRQRMIYPKFRAQGFCAISGTVEAGGRNNVVDQRFKHNCTH